MPPRRGRSRPSCGVLADMHPTEAMEVVINRMRKTKTNAEFLLSMNLG
ncbi:MAG: hypothetical protein U0797_27835 [Gemmataceae bacterium]